eukprot:1193882-Prorocentrum_minimum.AAC.3
MLSGPPAIGSNPWNMLSGPPAIGSARMRTLLDDPADNSHRNDRDSARRRNSERRKRKSTKPLAFHPSAPWSSARGPPSAPQAAARCRRTTKNNQVNNNGSGFRADGDGVVD